MKTLNRNTFYVNLMGSSYSSDLANFKACIGVSWNLTLKSYLFIEKLHRN